MPFVRIALLEGKRTSLKSMSDAAQDRDEMQMITAILAGDTKLYHDLIRPYERRVYKMALSFVKNEADAEDVAQEAFLKAYHHLASFRGEAKFSTWLIAIAINESRSRVRRVGAIRIESIDQASQQGDHVFSAILRDRRELPSEALERKETRRMLQNAIVGLPEIYREVFLLRDMEELSNAETAEALTVSIGTVKVRLHRARVMLQKRLAPQLKDVNPERRWLPSP
jgi:RNA polymerase sigma-70 factor, ECF subfamily